MTPPAIKIIRPIALLISAKCTNHAVGEEYLVRVREGEGSDMMNRLFMFHIKARLTDGAWESGGQAISLWG